MAVVTGGVVNGRLIGQFSNVIVNRWEESVLWHLMWVHKQRWGPSVPKGHEPLGPTPPIRALTDIPRKGPRPSAAGARTSVSTLHFLDSTLSAPGRRTSVSAPLGTHPKASAPTGSERVGTEHAPSRHGLADVR